MTANTITLPSGTVVLAPPAGLTGVHATYGIIAVLGGRIVTPKHWESDNMTTISDFPGVNKRLYVNKAIVAPLREALRLCIDRHDGYAIHSIGCFNPRPKRSNGNELSLHSWGVAVDINPDKNPMGRPLVKDIPNEWIAIFESCGWTWGGHFPIADPMHFQWARGY